ncbi:MAG: ArnT family glycosyltransferase [Myxococcota bacterium]
MFFGAESVLRSFVSTRPGHAAAAAIALGALAFALFVGLGSAPIGRLSEERCVWVVKRMVENGQLLVPRFAGKVRLQKPPLFYWAGALVAKRSGDTGPWSVRAVSAAAALGLAAVVLAWGSTVGGRGEGLVALGLLAAMQQITSSGRRGDAEMLLAFFSAAALFCFDRIHAERRRALLPLFALLAGLAFLTKATAVFITIALPILVALALQRELRSLRAPSVIATFAGIAAIGVSWYVAIVVLVPGSVESLREVLLLPLGSISGHSGSTHFRPPWWYLSVLPGRAAPASLLLPLVVWRLWRTRVHRGDPHRRFAALAFLVPFAAFSLLPQKQKHYTLPMLAGLALCSADAVIAAARELAPYFRAALRALGAPLALAGLAATSLLALFYLWVEAFPLATILAWSIVPVALFVFGALAALAARPASFGASWLIGFLLAVGLARGIVEPRIDYLSWNFVHLPIDDRERLLTLKREHPWFARIVFAVKMEDSG